jgi:hypothetical protein
VLRNGYDPGQDVIFTCARCRRRVESKRIPFERGQRWRLRDGQHICVDCWPSEPAEQQTVYRYCLWRPHLPPEFWSQQRAARCLWDALCETTTRTLADAQTLRARYAPEEAAAAEAQRAVASAAWDFADETRCAWRSAPQPIMADDPAEQERRRLALLELERRADEAKAAAARESARLGQLYGTAKRAARAAGCDESHIWAGRDKVFADAPKWTYVETRDAEGRLRVERSPDGWRLHSGLAYLTVEQYRRAWSAWLNHRDEGRGMPSPHGQGIGDRVRAVLTYSNGMGIARLTRGTPSLSLRPARVIYDDAKRAERCRHLTRAERAASKPFCEKCATITTPSSYVPRFRFSMAVAPGAHATGMLMVHRPVPEDADCIRQVELVGERSGWNRWTFFVNITVRQRLATCAPEDKRADALAIDLRWRVDDRYLQVAHWMDSDGDEGEINLDLAPSEARKKRDWLSSWGEMESLQREISEDMERAKAMLWAQQHGEAPMGESFRRMGSRTLLRAIGHGEWPGFGGALVKWADEHGMKHRRLARLRMRLIARRDQVYYEAAHALCRRAKVLVFEGDGKGKPMSLKKLAEGDDARAGDQRMIASPYRLRTILTQVARRYGTATEYRDCRRTSTTCPDCSAQAEQTGRLLLTCANGHTFDQRRAACTELLRRLREQPDDGASPGAARTGKQRGKRTESVRGGEGEGGRGRKMEPLATAPKRRAGPRG